MRAVSVVQLRNGLSRYLVAVQQGEEILIRARRRPVAKIVPIRISEETEEGEQLLAAAGLLKLGEGPIPSSFWSKPSLRVSAQTLQRALSASRANLSSTGKARHKPKTKRRG